MVLRSWVDLICCSLNQSEWMSPHPTIWLRQVGLLSSQSEPWVDAACSLKIEHPGCAENQAPPNHRCSVEHVLFYALVKYTIQLALQNTFSYTRYNHVFWALTSQQHTSVSQGRIFSDNCTCCHTEVEAADQTFYLTQSQYTDTWSTSPSSDTKTPGVWQGSHWSANF